MLRRRNTALQTNTPAFKRWFGDSKVVDAQGRPLVVYHGTTAQFEAFERRPGAHLGFHFGTGASSEDKLRGDIKRWREGEAWLGTRRGAGPMYLSTDEMRDAAREVYRAEEVRLTAERNRIERGIRERAVPIDLFALVDAHGGDVDAAMEEFHALRETQDAKPTASETRRLAELEDARRENEERLAAVFAYRRPGESVIPVYLSIQNPLRMQDTNWGDVSMIKRDHPRLRLQGRTLAEIRSEIERRGYDGIVYENKVEDVGSDSWIAFHPTQVKSAIGNAGTFDPDDPSMLRNPRRQNPEIAAYLKRVCDESPIGRLTVGGPIDSNYASPSGGRGYHDTSLARAESIRRAGLGAHPGLAHAGLPPHERGGIEGHEVGMWLCAWVAPDEARRIVGRNLPTKGHHGVYSERVADEVSAHLLQTLPDLKVVWFYDDPERGGISKYEGARCSFDLRTVVDWLAENATQGPYLYGYDDIGFCLSWRGPTIPPRFLRWDKTNPDRRTRR